MMFSGNTFEIKRKKNRNTTPAKPREGRFGYKLFVCFKISRLVFLISAETNTHCVSYNFFIVDELTVITWDYS